MSKDNVDPGEEDKCPSGVLCRRSGAGHLYGVDWVTLADHANRGGIWHSTRKESMTLNDTNCDKETTLYSTVQLKTCLLPSKVTEITFLVCEVMLTFHKQNTVHM